MDFSCAEAIKNETHPEWINVCHDVSPPHFPSILPLTPSVAFVR